MKTVLEIIKGLATNGNGGRSRKGTVAFVTMMDDTNFIVNYLISQLKAEKIKFVSETENEETFSVSGGSTLTIKKDGQGEFLGYILDNYTVTYRTARGGVYIVYASSKNTQATAKFIASQDVINQAPIIETPAAEVNEIEYATENIIAEFESNAQGFLNKIPKLIDAGTLSNSVFEPITFTNQRTTFDLQGYGEGAKLILHTGIEFKTPRASKGKRVAAIELVLADGARQKSSYLRIA